MKINYQLNSLQAKMVGRQFAKHEYATQAHADTLRTPTLSVVINQECRNNTHAQNLGFHLERNDWLIIYI